MVQESAQPETELWIVDGLPDAGASKNQAKKQRMTAADGVGSRAPSADTIGVYARQNRRAALRAIRYLSSELEQVHVIGKYCRSLRLHWIAAFGIALAVLPPVRAFAQATTITLTAQSSTQACPNSEQQTTTLTTLSVSVTSSSGTPQGTVNIMDQTSPTAPPVQIANAILNPSGQATMSLYLAPDVNGNPHSLSAVYSGNASYTQSTSTPVSVDIAGTQCSSPFAISISGITPSTSGVMTLTPGDSGTATVTVTPSQEYVASLANGAPAFVTISCSGLPSFSSCSFTPQTLEIQPDQDAGIVSTMLIQTESSTARTVPPAQPGHRSSPVAWAVLLPGMLGLGGLAWGSRRRRWLQRLSLVALIGLVTTLGTTACNPLYNYYNHGPTYPHETPAGTFNVAVTGQSSNGVTATTISTTMVLTVQ